MCRVISINVWTAFWMGVHLISAGWLPQHNFLDIHSSGVHFFLWLSSYSTVWMYLNVFNHLSVEGHCLVLCKSCPTLCDPKDCHTPGSSVLHYLLEFAQIHVHWVDDAIQPSHPLSHTSPPALSLSQHQGLFQWAGSSCQVAKVLELLCIRVLGEYILFIMEKFKQK